MRKSLHNPILIVAVVAIFAALALFTACKKDEPVQVEEMETMAVVEEPAPPVKVAVVGAHSGDLASYGLPTVNAAKLVADWMNARNGVGGRPIELIIEDDQCKPEIAVNSATKAVGDGADVVLGHICSGATKAALNIYKDARLVVMSPSATNPALTLSGDYPNFYRTIASDDAQARLEVDFAIKKLGLKKIAVLHDKGDYGKGLAEFAKEFIEKDPQAELVLYEGITPGAVDYSAVVQKIKRSGAEAVIFGGYHPEASKLVTQMRKKDMDTILISDDGVKDDTFIKVAKEYAEGVYATGPMDTSKNPLAKQAVKQHKDAFGTEPGAFFLNAYAAMQALMNAIDKAGSTDYEAVRKALQEEYVATPLGIIRFDANGDAIGVGFSMYQVQNGMYVEVDE